MQLSNKPTDPKITLVENECQSEERLLTMTNVKSVLSKFKKPASSDENWPEIFFWQKLLQHAVRKIGVPTYGATVLAFAS